MTPATRLFSCALFALALPLLRADSAATEQGVVAFQQGR